MTATLAERATIKIGGVCDLSDPCASDWNARHGYLWFQRLSPMGPSGIDERGMPIYRPGTKYYCRVCGPGWGLFSRVGRFPHVLRDISQLGIKECADRIRTRFLNRRIDRHRHRGQFYHEAPQGVAYRRPE